MTTTVPELRRPPHDPLTLLLGGRLGWPVLDAGPSPAALPATLSLPRDPVALRRWDEASGSLGGVRLPRTVALDAQGTTWLLDRDRSRVRRFDPCACRFDDVACLGGPGSAVGQLLRPEGLAVASGHLLVADTGNERVQVVLMPQGVVSGVWRAPMPWQPMGLAVDARFRVHVTDPATGSLHHFGWSGRYLGRTEGIGDATSVAVLADGWLLVGGGKAGAWLVDPDGAAQPFAGTSADLADRVVPLPYAVSRDGALHLGPVCQPPGDGWVGADGSPVAASGPDPVPLLRSGTVIVGPLDSQLDACVWDRISLRGEVPAGCSVRVDTLSAQVALTPAEVAAAPEAAWACAQVCTAMTEPDWDTLVRSPAGRYLWLRLGLVGTGTATPLLAEALVEFPRISLRRHLPAVFGQEPVSADFVDRLLAIVDRQLRGIEDRIDGVPALLDPHASEHLAWLASMVGMTPDRRLPERAQRQLVAESARLYDLRGTLAGLHRVLVVALGLDALGGDGPGLDALAGAGCAPRCGPRPCAPPRTGCPPQEQRRHTWAPPPLVLEHFRLRRWFEAGASTLGDRTVLWGESIVNRSQLGGSARVGASQLVSTPDPARDPYLVHAHRFTVFLPASAAVTPQRQRAVEQLVAAGSPAHTQATVTYVEARMRVGVQSAIGLDTVVARAPGAAAALGGAELGGTVLDGGGTHGGGGARTVGTTTVLG